MARWPYPSTCRFWVHLGGLLAAYVNFMYLNTQQLFFYFLTFFWVAINASPHLLILIPETSTFNLLNKHLRRRASMITADNFEGSV